MSRSMESHIAGADPESETAHVASEGRIKGKGTTDNPDCEGSGSNDQDRAERFTTLRVRLGIAGYAFTQTRQPDGAMAYQASRWGMTRALESLVDAEAFAVCVGVTL